MQLQWTWPSQKDPNRLATTSWMSFNIYTKKQTNTDELKVVMIYNDNKEQVICNFGQTITCEHQVKMKEVTKEVTEKNSDKSDDKEEDEKDEKDEKEIVLEVKVKPNILSSKRDGKQFQFYISIGDDYVTTPPFTTVSKLRKATAKLKTLEKDNKENEDEIFLVAEESLEEDWEEDKETKTLSQRDIEESLSGYASDNEEIFTKDLAEFEEFEEEDLLNLWEQEEKEEKLELTELTDWKKKILALERRVDILERHIKRSKSSLSYMSPYTDTE